MGYKYYKVTPEPVFVRVVVGGKDEIQEAALEADAGQVWRDALSYGQIEFVRVSKSEAQEAGYFVEEEEMDYDE